MELDLTTGTRSRRGAAARAALLAACPAAEDALVVNNGAAALVLATTALAAGREVVVSRGELIEIGAGFRLPDLIASTGARLREVGTTNRTHLRDYTDAIGPDTGCVLKVHPSNFRVEGFTAAVTIADLRTLADEHRVPLVVDLGSGLLAPDPLLPDEPDAATALAAGADVVTASGDKLLGGPQAGLVLGRAQVVGRHGPAPAGPRGPGRQARPGRARGDRRRSAGHRSRRRCTRTPTGSGPGPNGSPRNRSAPAGRWSARRPGRRRRGAGRAAARAGPSGCPNRSRRRCAPATRRCCPGCTTALACWTCAACPKPTTTGCSTPSARALVDGSAGLDEIQHCMWSWPPPATSTTARAPWSAHSPAWNRTAGPRNAAAA